MCDKQMAFAKKLRTRQMVPPKRPRVDGGDEGPSESESDDGSQQETPSSPNSMEEALSQEKARADDEKARADDLERQLREALAAKNNPEEELPPNDELRRLRARVVKLEDQLEVACADIVEKNANDKAKTAELEGKKELVESLKQQLDVKDNQLTKSQAQLTKSQAQLTKSQETVDKLTGTLDKAVSAYKDITHIGRKMFDNRCLYDGQKVTRVLEILDDNRELLADYGIQIVTTQGPYKCDDGETRPSKTFSYITGTPEQVENEITKRNPTVWEIGNKVARQEHKRFGAHKSTANPKRAIENINESASALAKRKQGSNDGKVSTKKIKYLCR